jgi:hypothetical protein
MDYPPLPDGVAGVRGLELAKVVFGKPLKLLGKFSSDLPTPVGPETFRV